MEREGGRCIHSIGTEYTHIPCLCIFTGKSKGDPRQWRHGSCPDDSEQNEEHRGYLVEEA